MEMLQNIQTREIGEIVSKDSDGVVLNVDGVTRKYANSTIKRWWKQYIAPTPVATPSTPTVGTVITRTPIATKIINYLTQRGCTVKETKSYIGIKFGKSTIMEIHCTKRGKTTIVVNKKALSEGFLEEIVSNNNGKVVPDSYGWTLNLKVNADTLGEADVISVAQFALDYYAN